MNPNTRLENVCMCIAIAMLAAAVIWYSEATVALRYANEWGGL